MEEQKFLIPIDEPLEEFKNHIEPEYNKRIIFSAPFGTGKTYFLDQYFNHHKKNEYNSFFLYPVNYSVSSNEDVFELIKFDILFQLLENEELQLQPNDFEDLFIAQNYLYNKANNIFEWILNLSGKIGKNIVKIANSLEIIVKEYKKFKESTTNNLDLDRSLDFILDIKNKPGHAYEEDAVTHLIQKLLQKFSENGKQSILVIDDLDRIDPEHIFRLLNVFAAHFDIGAPNTNKFGFEKVIFVCDLNNIRNIFHTRYGIDTDFIGYLDKFYSTEVFSFDNSKQTIDELSQFVLRKFYVKNFENQTNFSHLSNSASFKALFKSTLAGLLTSNSINLRAILKLDKHPIPLKVYDLKFNFFNERVSNTNSYIVTIFDILKGLSGSYTNVYKSLLKAATFNETILLQESNARIYSNIHDEFTTLYMHVLPILTIDNQYGEEDGQTKRSVNYTSEPLNMIFKVEFDSNRNRYFDRIIWCSIKHAFPIEKTNKVINHTSNQFKLLVEVFEKLKRLGHLID